MKKGLTVTVCLIFLYLFCINILKAQSVEILQQGKPVSIRGLSVVNDKIAWLSSNKGYTAITIDGGKNWTWQQVKGFEKVDFRDIEAFSDKEAIIMSSGTPALILKTIDGGIKWQVKYSNIDTAYFLDAMDFADSQHGYILGDPIDEKFVLLETKDGGDTWDMFNNRPAAMPGEAAFAASGTCIRVSSQNIKVVTGGLVTRCLTNDLLVNTWNAVSLPIAHGGSSKGGFSISADGLITVGGNYSKDKATDSIACVSNSKTKNIFYAIKAGPLGYQSCVERLNKNFYISTGTSGTNISIDNGETWKQIDGTSYNVCRKAKRGKLVLLAGDGGKIAIFKN